MTRRLLAFGALASLSICFAAAVQLWLRFVRQHCGVDVMGAADCYWTQVPNMDMLFALFAVAAILLAALVLLPDAWSEESLLPNKTAALLGLLAVWVVAALACLFLTAPLWSMSALIAAAGTANHLLRYLVFGALVLWLQLYVAIAAVILKSPEN